MSHRWVADGGDDEVTVGSLDGLYDDFGRPDLARHLAVFPGSRETHLGVATTFVRRGLDDGNRCVYFVDATTRADLLTALRAAGVDVDARLAAGDLVVSPGVEAYADAGFDPGRLIARLEETCAESLADGYEGLWLAIWIAENGRGSLVVPGDADYQFRLRLGRPATVAP